jgi:hypothetical protein
MPSSSTAVPAIPRLPPDQLSKLSQNLQHQLEALLPSLTQLLLEVCGRVASLPPPVITSTDKSHTPESCEVSVAAAAVLPDRSTLTVSFSTEANCEGSVEARHSFGLECTMLVLRETNASGMTFTASKQALAKAAPVELEPGPAVDLDTWTSFRVHGVDALDAQRVSEVFRGISMHELFGVINSDDLALDQMFFAPERPVLH